MLKFITVLLLLSSISMFAQTQHTDFLKTKPAINQETPQWAALMYSDNPHVPTLDSLYRLWRQANPVAKTVHTQNYKQWRRFIEPWVDTDGYISQLSKYDESLKTTPQTYRDSVQGTREGVNWTIVGPIESYSQENRVTNNDWQANVFSIDVFNGNANILYCGTEAGGIFKTIDKGLNWTFATKESSIKSVQALKIHPTNADIVFAAEHTTLFRTTDGGATWVNVYSGSEINEIAIHPNMPNIVFIITNTGIIRSSANGDAGSFTTNVLNQKAFDLRFKPNDPSVIFALADDPAEKMCRFYKSTDNGASFSIRSSGWLSLNTTDNPMSERANEGGRIAVTPANPNRIYAYLAGATKSGDNGHIGLWKTDDAGESWVLVSPRIGAPYTSSNLNLSNFAPTTGNGFWLGFYCLTIMVSPTDADQLLLGTVTLYRSTNGGKTMSPIGGYYGTMGLHPDYQSMVAKGSDTWVSCDGGIL